MKNSAAPYCQDEIFSRAECEVIWTKARELFPHWRRIQSPDHQRLAPFFMLGNSLYAHRKNLRGYEAESRRLNGLILRQFAGEFGKIERYLGRKLRRPVRMVTRGLGVPGFHIFKLDRQFQVPVSRWHVDFDFLTKRWTHPVKIEGIRAFTIPIALPRRACHFDYLDLRQDEIGNLRSHRELDAFERRHGFKRVRHRLGHVLLQDGRVYHRIGALPPPGANSEFRVTWQGSLVFQRDHWKVFW